MTLPQLKEDLLQRWLTALKNSSSRPACSEAVANTVHAEHELYNLKDYTPTSFPAKKFPLIAKPEPYSRQYDLDAQGRPVCFIQFQTIDTIRRAGYYQYGEGFADYVEYSLDGPTPSPSWIERVTYSGNRKVSFQSLSLNGGSLSYEYWNLSHEQIFQQIQDDNRSLILTVETYYYAGDRIDHAACLHIAPYSGIHTSQKQYHYEEDGTLADIEETYDSGARVYEYVKPPAYTSLEEFADQVAEQMTTDIVQILISNPHTQPIGMLELSYQYCYRFLPTLLYVTAAEQQQWEPSAEPGDDIFSLLLEDNRELASLGGSPSDRLMTAFVQEIELSERYDLARSILLQVSRNLNQDSSNRQWQAGEHFVAYAIDWSMSPDPLEVLEECGVATALLQRYKQYR